jgi:hypothetical protein
MQHPSGELLDLQVLGSPHREFVRRASDPAKADFAAAAEVGYTTGTYQASMSARRKKGKFGAVWKKQSDGLWKVKEDISNPNGGGAAPTSHVMIQPASIKWGDPPPSLPRGSKTRTSRCYTTGLP